MSEGGLKAPIRHRVDWRNPDFHDSSSLDIEMRRVFDVCHGCRRCFNLCDSFPRLFDLIDETETGEIDQVKSENFFQVAEACTLCDMCYMTKCPYVPPHEFNIDFPHLMLRYRSFLRKNGRLSFIANFLSQVDLVANLVRLQSNLFNWFASKKNKFFRLILDTFLKIDKNSVLPTFSKNTLVQSIKNKKFTLEVINEDAPAFGKKVVIFATCYVNNNDIETGVAAQKVLAKNGIDAKIIYPGCCGMPLLEQGNMEGLTKQAEPIIDELEMWINKGYDIVTLTSSCGLMLKSEWSLILDNEYVIKSKFISKRVYDICEYIVLMANSKGLADGMSPLEKKVTLHHSCHSRAQNMGTKSLEMLKLIPSIKIDFVEKCSGHGGTFGVVKPTHKIAEKIGTKVVKTSIQKSDFIVSDCPLACKHLHHMGLETKTDVFFETKTAHPIEIFCQSYNL